MDMVQQSVQEEMANYLHSKTLHKLKFQQKITEIKAIYSKRAHCIETKNWTLYCIAMCKALTIWVVSTIFERCFVVITIIKYSPIYYLVLNHCCSRNLYELLHKKWKLFSPKNYAIQIISSVRTITDNTVYSIIQLMSWMQSQQFLQQSPSSRQGRYIVMLLMTFSVLFSTLADSEKQISSCRFIAFSYKVRSRYFQLV